MYWVHCNINIITIMCSFRYHKIPVYWGLIYITVRVAVNIFLRLILNYQLTQGVTSNWTTHNYYTCVCWSTTTWLHVHVHVPAACTAHVIIIVTIVTCRLYVYMYMYIIISLWFPLFPEWLIVVDNVGS